MNFNFISMLYVVEVYLGLFHTSMMELFLKIVNGF